MVWLRLVRLAVGLGPVAVGAMDFRESLAEVAGTSDVSVLSFERASFELLQVGRLRVDEEVIDQVDADIVDEVQVDSHADAGEELHRLLGADGLGGLARCRRPADAVMKSLLVLFDEASASGSS